MSLYSRIAEDQDLSEGSLNAFEKRRMQLDGDKKFESLRAAARTAIIRATKALKKVETYAGGFAAFTNEETPSVINFQGAGAKLGGLLKKPVVFVPVGGWKHHPELKKKMGR